MELLSGFLKDNYSVLNKYQSMQPEELKRVLGALSDGRLKVAVDKYLTSHEHDFNQIINWTQTTTHNVHNPSNDVPDVANPMRKDK